MKGKVTLRARLALELLTEKTCTSQGAALDALIVRGVTELDPEVMAEADRRVSAVEIQRAKADRVRPRR